MTFERQNRKENRYKESKENKKPELDSLVESGEWTRLNESPEFMKMTREGRIVTVKKAVGHRVKQLEGFFYSALVKFPGKSEVILDKMRYLRGVNDALDDVMVGNIKEEQMPSQLRSLVKTRQTS